MLPQKIEMLATHLISFGLNCLNFKVATDGFDRFFSLRKIQNSEKKQRYRYDSDIHMTILKG